MLGIRSRTQLTAEVLESASRLIAVGCFCIGTNQVDVQAARRWLQARKVGDSCPLCHGQDMKVSKDFFVALGIQAENGAPDLGSGSPMVRLRCATCGRVSAISNLGLAAFKKRFGHVIGPDWDPTKNGFLTKDGK